MAAPSAGYRGHLCREHTQTHNEGSSREAHLHPRRPHLARRSDSPDLGACSSPASSTDGSSDGAKAEGNSLAAIQKAGVLTVGTEGTYKPFSYHEDGTGDLTGYDVEIITAVAKKLDVDVKFEETQWDAIFAGLEAGRFDVIANQVSINDERTAKYDFSKPYTVSPGVIVVKKDNTDISSFADLA